jgi:hypothetical protein
MWDDGERAPDGRVPLLERAINHGVPLAVVTNWLARGGWAVVASSDAALAATRWPSR